MAIKLETIEKNKCRFKHYRLLTNFKEFNNKKPNNKNKYYTSNIKTNKNRLSNKGGITISTYIDREEKNIYIGIAFCNNIDLFVKKNGSDQAFNNLIKSPLIVSLPISNNEELKFVLTSVFLGKYIKSIVQNYISNNLKNYHHKILI